MEICCAHLVGVEGVVCDVVDGRAPGEEGDAAIAGVRGGVVVWRKVMLARLLVSWMAAASTVW